MPYISQAYLINATLLKGKFLNRDGKSYSPSYIDGADLESDNIDAEIIFCESLRQNDIFMYVTNLVDFGYLVNSETYDIRWKHPDFYEIYSNQKDWARTYIHENYSRVLEKDYEVDQPCPDVYWYPVVTPTFCKHLIEIMEHFGKWSDGTNQVSFQRKSLCMYHAI